MPDEPKQALDFDEVSEILSDLECLNFFPASDAGRLAIQKIVGSMASNVDQVRWLVGRVLQLYNNWPGPAELRAVFCKRFPPADGFDVRNTHTSEFFPDGNIPCETPEAPPYRSDLLLTKGRQDLLLPAGRVSADVEAENLIRKASADIAMSAEKRRQPAVLVPAKDYKPISRLEMERIAREFRAARSAPHEFEDSGTGGLCRVCWLAHSGEVGFPARSEQKTA